LCFKADTKAAPVLAVDDNWRRNVMHNFTRITLVCLKEKFMPVLVTSNACAIVKYSLSAIINTVSGDVTG